MYHDQMHKKHSYTHNLQQEGYHFDFCCHIDPFHASYFNELLHI